MTIEVEQVKKLIEDYRRSESVCIQSGKGPIASGQASVWRMAIEDLESLLPRKSMAEVDPETWPELVGTWVEHDGESKVIFEVVQIRNYSIGLFCPKSGWVGFSCPEHAFLTEHSAAWDTEGNPL